MYSRISEKKMNSKIGLVGYLGYATDQPIIGGQMSKTRGVYKQLIEKYGKDRLHVIDTSNWRAEKCRLVLQCVKMAFTCKTIIIMPNKNGIKFVLPFFSKCKKIFGYRLAYPVVGGWLTSLLEKHGYLKSSMRNVDFVLPETKELQRELRAYYTGRISTMSIFSTREPVRQTQIPAEYDAPYTFCTFSRVTPEKGIDEAIQAIELANKRANQVVCRLDVWGPIEKGMEEHYHQLFQTHSSCVQYRGILKDEQGLDCLAAYYMMIFPTFYPGEGFPTAVCESFMTGLPVIASNWRFNPELVQEGETGYLFEVHNVEELAQKILEAVSKPEVIRQMHFTCLEKSKAFQPAEVMRDLDAWINNDAV